MDYSQLSSRAIMGMYFARLEASPGTAWIDGVSNLFTSDQGTEQYKFLGMSPVMQEWIGGRQLQGFRQNGVTIVNKHFESSVEIPIIDIRRDKTEQIRARIEDLADRTVTHWASLLSTLLLNGASTVCYDGKYYFDTTHVEGDSGTQSNSINVDISDVESAPDNPAMPTVKQIQWAIAAGIVQIMTFKDDRGEPMNDAASRFIVIVPPSLYPAAASAVNEISTRALQQNVNPNLLSGMNVEIYMNPRLTSWTTKFAVFRTDSPLRGLIRQQEYDVELKVQAEGSPAEFERAVWQFGVDAWRNVGYGYWQRACLVTMI